ncbi:MAG: hypothetical protein OEV28_03890 [Nitrospirota bacterium]|nr:hypothetical protein [Nitrospirota bacterium]
MTEDKPNENLLVAEWVDRDGKVHREYAPYPSDKRWQGIHIDSASFKQLPHPERLYRLSQAFLDAAVHLCERAGESGKDIEWPQASVCFYLLHLATEQFLKACVLRLGTQPDSMNHDISGLRRKYHELLPSAEFEWHTPWEISAQDIEDTLGFKVFHGIDRTPDQLYRYGANKSGAPSAGLQMFAPSTQMGYMCYLKKRWTKIWNEIAAKPNVQQGTPPEAASRCG